MKNSLYQSAIDILNSNDRGTYSLPTQGLYPVQFNWDSAFAALGYRLLNPTRAWQEVQQLASSQWPDGMIPHIMFRGDHEGYFPGPEVWNTGQFIPTSGITQPPVLASVVRRLDETHPLDDSNAMQDMLRRLVRWHEWFMQARLDPQSEAILIIHPWESGRDNMSDWDCGMARVEIAELAPYKRRDLDHVDASQRPTKEEYDRYLSIVKFGRDNHWKQDFLGKQSPFRMVDPGMTAFLLRSSRDLLALLNNYQADNTTAIAQVQQHISTLTRGWNNLWNDKVNAYTAYDPVEQRLLDNVTSVSFMSCYAGVCDDTRHGKLMDEFDRISKLAKYMVPSFDPAHADFDAKRYWRGPVWLVINNVIGVGLAEHGETQRAERIRADSEQLVANSDFFEYFNPITGEGLGGKDFTWTATVYLDWVMQGSKNGKD